MKFPNLWKKSLALTSDPNFTSYTPLGNNTSSNESPKENVDYDPQDAEEEGLINGQRRPYFSKTRTWICIVGAFVLGTFVGVSLSRLTRVDNVLPNRSVKEFAPPSTYYVIGKFLVRCKNANII